MKEIICNVTKKNRKYYAAQSRTGFTFKILIDENSQDLALGDNTLICEDISVRSKYGTDVIYKVLGAIKPEEKNKIVSLKHFKYNKFLVDECKQLAGKWDEEEKAWIFHDFVADKVEELDFIYNSDLVTIELKANTDIFFHTKPAHFMGYTLCRATGRDSGAHLSEDVSLISGTVCSSGSMKNWGTKIKEGATFRLQIPREVLNQLDDSDWTAKII